MKLKTLRNLFTAALAFTCTSAFAGDWEIPTNPFETGVAPTNGAKVMFYNVGTDACMGSGKISAAWETSAILYDLTENPERVLSFELVDNGDETWSIRTASGSHSGKYTFAPTGGDHPYMFVDMGWEGQGGRRWKIEEAEGGYTLALSDNIVNGETLAEEGTYMGTDGDTWDVICNADPENGGQVVWTFVPSDDVLKYNVRVEMYELLYEAEEYKSIDLTAISATYNNADATLEELKEALSALKAAILKAEMEEGGYEPTPDDPLDLTDQLLKNPSFDGDVSGWENIGGMTHDPNGTVYNGSSYMVGEDEYQAQLSGFCEKWTPGPNKLGNEYGIYQVVSLPEGLYRFEADALAHQQSDGSLLVSGVTLYVKNASLYEVSVATPNNSPKHYVIEFMSDGVTPTELGFHVDATTDANWVAVDNFKISSLGKSTLSAAALKLQNAIKSANAQFPEDEFDFFAANAATKAAYVAALDAANEVLANAAATDEQCVAAQSALEAAAQALADSKSDYNALNSALQKFNNLSGALLDYDLDGSLENTCNELAAEISTIIDDAEAGKEIADLYTNLYNAYDALYHLFEYTAERKEANADDDVLVGMIEAEENVLRTAWVEQTYKTPADVAAAKDKIAGIIANYLNAAIKPQSDLTYLLVNPNFDENYNGWDMNGYNNPGYSYSEVEYFQKNFNVSQTLKAMPKGRYTLTVQGYQRRSEVNAVLYANENEVKLWNVRDKANDEGYFPGAGDGAYPSDSYTEGVGYYPNSMEGARQWFDAFEEDGVTPLYTNTLDFFLTESDVTDLTIGVKSADNGDWCLFDNFTLYYHGNRAEDYANGLEELIEELDNTMAEGYVTVALTNTANAAKNAAKNAIKNNDANACIAAIPTLKAAIEEAKATLVLTQTLADKAGFIAEYRIDDVISSTKGEFTSYVEGVIGKLTDGNIKDNDEIDAIADELDVKFTQCVQHDGLATATEQNPFDMTAAIVNPSYECGFAYEKYNSEYNPFGWEGDQPSCNEFSAEFWAADWTAGKDVHQTIKGLAPGWYKLYVYGYNRQGYGNDHVEKPVSESRLYAGEYSTKLHDVLDELHEDSEFFPEEEGQNVSEVEIDGTTYYYPGNMPSSRVCFDNDEYKNMLVFKVEEGQKEITIGLRKTTFAYWDSLMFDDWSLAFVGSTEPTEVNTAVENIASANNVRTSFYTLNGVEMSKPVKGVNIIKRTDSNGRVNVSKIMVK